VVDVPNGADVYVRLSPLELGLRHWYLLVAIRPTGWGPGAPVQGRRQFYVFLALLAASLDGGFLGDHAARHLGITRHGLWR
jgi:hypothetical protein